MKKAVLIADDLTGANVTGALLTKNGYSFATFLESENINPSILSNYDVTAISTDSRNSSPETGAKRVANAAINFKPHNNGFYQKRIDSTLRGNIGAETDALLEIIGNNAVAFVCAAYPEVGKQVIGDYLVVNGELLEKTGVSKDPKNPVTRSSVQSIIASQSKYPVDCIEIEKIVAGSDTILAEIEKLITQGTRIISFDALNEQDITNIALACSFYQKPYFLVDPGPLTLALLRIKNKIPTQHKIFLSIGSVVETARQQITTFEDAFATKLICIYPKQLLSSSSKAKEIKRVLRLLNEESDSPFVGLISCRKDTEVINLSELAYQMKTDPEAISQKINKGIAEITACYLQTHSEVRALYTSGGDITLAVCSQLGALGIHAVNEIEPFTMHGKLIGGEYDKLNIITKGGLAGNFQTLKNAMTYIQKYLTEREK